MNKVIPLTRGRVAIVDDADYEELSKRKWFYTQVAHMVKQQFMEIETDRLAKLKKEEK